MIIHNYEVNKSRFFVYIAYVLGLFYLGLKANLQDGYFDEYVVLLSSYIIVGWLICDVIVHRNADIFEPILILLLLLFCIFTVAPIILTSEGTTAIYGQTFMPGCIKATMIYVGACISSYLGYYSVCVDKDKYSIETYVEKPCNPELCIQVMIIIWCICYIIALAYEVIFLGRSLSYILSIGSSGQINQVTNETSVAFLVNFSYSLVVPWLYICFQSRNKLLKCFMTMAMITLYIVCGWRFIIVIMGLAFATIYYVQKNKRPSMFAIASIVIVALIIFSIIGAARHDLRSGNSFEWQFNFDGILETLETNFNIYQPFYGVVSYYPSNHPYTYGEGMIFDTLITFIPRAIWPSKPLARNFASLEAIRLSLGNGVIDKAAMAMPNIGEMYVDFGIIGVFFIMFLLGRGLRKLARLYLTENTSFESLLFYSCMYALVFQFTTRGYMPNNFYLLIFVIWPAVVVNVLSKNRLRR